MFLYDYTYIFVSFAVLITVLQLFLSFIVIFYIRIKFNFKPIYVRSIYSLINLFIVNKETRNIVLKIIVKMYSVCMLMCLFV